MEWCVQFENPCCVLQILLAVYFFLAGIAVSHSRLLWVTPFASVAYLAAFMLSNACVASYGGLNDRIRSDFAFQNEMCYFIQFIPLRPSSILKFELHITCLLASLH